MKVLRHLAWIPAVAITAAGYGLVKALGWLATTDIHTVEVELLDDLITVDDVLHVIPRDDLIEHAADEDCVCGPTPEAVFRDDGSNGWIYRHHSLDARELTE